MKRIAVILFSLLLLTGCAKAPEEEVKIITEESSEGGSYSFVAVKRGTITNEIGINCKYVPGEQVECAFSEQDREVAEVLVERGDLVKKGQVLARQNVEEFEESILEEQHAMEMAQLSIKQLQDMQAMELDIMKQSFEYQDKETRDEEEYKLNVEEINRAYEQQIVDLQDEITVHGLRIQEYQSYIRNGTLTAPVSGVVMTSHSDLVGEISKSAEEVVTINRKEDLVFESTELEKQEYLEEGVPYHVIVEKGAKQRVVEVFYRPDAEGVAESEAETDTETKIKTLQFEVKSPDLQILSGDTGTIWVEKEKKENVLYLPNDVLYIGAGKAYVFVMGENGIRKICYVKTGISDRENTEILEGLEEGDYVLRE